MGAEFRGRERGPRLGDVWCGRRWLGGRGGRGLSARRPFGLPVGVAEGEAGFRNTRRASRNAAGRKSVGGGRHRQTLRARQSADLRALGSHVPRLKITRVTPIAAKGAVSRARCQGPGEHRALRSGDHAGSWDCVQRRGKRVTRTEPTTRRGCLKKPSHLCLKRVDTFRLPWAALRGRYGDRGASGTIPKGGLLPLRQPPVASSRLRCFFESHPSWLTRPHRCLRCRRPRTLAARACRVACFPRAEGGHRRGP